MPKNFKVQVKMSKNAWTTVFVDARYNEALVFTLDHQKDGNKYPLRIVRVIETVVFEGK